MCRTDSIKDIIYKHLEFAETRSAKLVQLFLLGLNLFACVLFVLSTYKMPLDLSSLLQDLELALAGVFLLEYLLRVGCSPNKRNAIFNFYSMIDLLSIITAILPSQSLSWLRMMRVFRILRFSRYLQDEFFFFGKVSDFTLQAFRVVYTVITLVFIYAGAIYTVEQFSESRSIVTYGDSLYFTVITLSTVGYGDITPSNEISRWLTILLIFSGMIFVPWQAGKLIRLLLDLETKKTNVVCRQCGLSRHDEDASHCKACGAVIYQEYQG
jgi:voltage-gated potassium channel